MSKAAKKIEPGINKEHKNAIKAGSEAEKLHKELYGEADKETDVVAETVESAPKLEAAPEVTEQPAPKAADTPAPVTEAPKIDAWEQKYKTLQGMFNAEVPKLNSQLAELSEQNRNLNSIIERMKQEKAAPMTDTAAENHVQKLLSQDDYEEYGEELISVVKRAAAEEFSPQLEALRKQNEELRTQNLQMQQSVGNFNAVQTKTKREQVFETLSREVPDWQTINVEPEFVDWLSMRDPIAGDTLQNMLNHAFEAYDAPRVAAIFKRYVGEKNIISGQHADQTQTETPTVNMDTLIAPGKPRLSGNVDTTQDVGETGIWAQAEIKAFYHDVQKGKFSDRPKEKDRIERQIVKAINEGRVR